MLFGAVARGYKRVASDQALVSQKSVFVEPEIPTSYELGIWSMLFDRTMTIDITALESDFKNVDGGVAYASRGGATTMREGRHLAAEVFHATG